MAHDAARRLGARCCTWCAHAYPTRQPARSRIRTRHGKEPEQEIPCPCAKRA